MTERLVGALQMQVLNGSDHADDGEPRIANFELMADSAAMREKLARKDLIADDERLALSSIARIEVSAAQNRYAERLEVSAVDSIELCGQVRRY